ncbi:MAG: hypothetical protein CEO22_642 [Candidatus Berkelbacteria bacterium Gr01-1014_85]|uniref:DUF1905 domain-containing protein n=1 Tax=Candidatus Berkelbacteria bacterium Gr01-1014_85 TaxID=2017150 RepID=A0A554J9I5_9BACT|nr:MAG: hypothetical protein CEO22_642 [Candidatus Berkelbacteria bacterium Gr01-1014_85]
MSTLSFESELSVFGQELVLHLPKAISQELPSRGMTLVNCTLNQQTFQAVLEPDEQGSHWFSIKPKQLDRTDYKAGDRLTVTIEPTKDWPEPKVPKDWTLALEKNEPVNELWQQITPMARWDWIRWFGAAKQLSTRQRRIQTALSMLQSGKRRPCCFDRNQCTLTDA